MGREIRVVSMVLHATKSFLRVDHFTTPHLKEEIQGYLLHSRMLSAASPKLVFLRVGPFLHAVAVSTPLFGGLPMYPPTLITPSMFWHTVCLHSTGPQGLASCLLLSLSTFTLIQKWSYIQNEQKKEPVWNNCGNHQPCSSLNPKLDKQKTWTSPKAILTLKIHAVCFISDGL